MKKKSKYAVCAVFLAAAALMGVNANAQESDDSISVYVNGSAVEFEDQIPVIDNNRALVPFRAVFEKMGVNVSWDEKTKTVTCSANDKIISLKADSDELNVNGKTVKTDVPAKIINGRVMVPLRVISESLGAEVKWDAAVKRAIITITDIQPQGIRSKQLYKEVTADDGTVIADCTISYPYLNGLGAGEDKINADLEAAAEAIWSEKAEDISASSKAAYSENKEDYFDYLNRYSIEADIICVYSDNGCACFVTNDCYYYDGSYDFSKDAAIYNLSSGERVSLKEYVNEDYDLLMKLAEEGITDDLTANRDNYGLNLTYVDMNKAGAYITDAGYTFFFQPDYIVPPDGLCYQYTVTYDELKRAADEKYGIVDKADKADPVITFTTEKTTKEAKAYDGTLVCYSDLEYPILQGDLPAIDDINSDYYDYIKGICNAYMDEYSDEAEDYYNSFSPEEFNGWGEYIKGEVTYLDNNKACILTTVSDYTGGAHPSSYKEALIYDLNSGSKLTLDDICINNEDKKRVLAAAEEGFRNMIENEPGDFYENALDMLDITKADYYLTDEGITFFYGQYDIAPYARGFVEYTLSSKF